MERRRGRQTHREFEALANYNDAHGRILCICRDLEGFADALPNRLDLALCHQLAHEIVALMKKCHANEERSLEELDLERVSSLKASIARLKSEHVRDQYSAEEIAEALSHISEMEPVANPDALGFMFRAFFEAQRRHIAFEKEQILPLLGSENNCSTG